MTDTTSAMREALEKARDALKAAEPYIEVHKRDLNLKSTDRVMQTDAAISEALIAIEAALTAPAQADMHATPKLDRALRYVESKLRHYDARPWTGSQEELQNLRDILADLKASPTPPPTEADWVPLAKALFATEGSPNVLGQAWFDFQGKAQRILAAMASAKPTPPRVDEKEMVKLLAETYLAAKGWETNRKGTTENGLRYIREDIALAFGRALMEKCK